MDIADYSIESASDPEDFNSNGSRLAYGGSRSDVYDWLSDIVMPSDFKMCNVVEIKFKGSRKQFYLNDQSIHLKNGELVVVESDMGGYDVGHVSLTGELVHMQLSKKNVRTEEVIKKICRKATPEDITKWKLAKGKELATLYKARDLAKELGLSMKLSDVDYQGDKSKATFYYTAEMRVDFRDLIKQLAYTFHIRVEMRQIGTREETFRTGGIGPCGSYFCCHTLSVNFKTDSSLAIRHQNNLRQQGNKFECYFGDDDKGISEIESNNAMNKPQQRHKSIVAKALINQNIIGQGSITRFDNKVNKGKKTK